MAKNSDSKLFAFLGVLLPIIGFVIVLLARKNDKYSMYYAKQGLVLGVVAIVANALAGMLVFLVIGIILMPVVQIISVILWIIGIVYSLSGEMKPIPIIGKFGEKFKF